MSWENEMHSAKVRHRPKLKGDWEQDGMYDEFPKFVETLSNRNATAQPDDINDEQQKQQQDHHTEESFFIDDETCQAWKDRGHPTLPVKLDAADTSKEQFFKYEIECLPCVIKNIPNGYDGGKFVGKWPGLDKWKLNSLANDVMLLDRRFKCGEDDDERTIRVKLRHFLEYVKHNRDDSPMYIFDSRFDDDKIANRILKEYRVPSYFSDDLFGLVSESRRPPYRWWLVGPKRSGTCVHIDPLATSAWNTLIEGQKRWVLFPPCVPKSVVKGSGLVHNNEDDEAVHYFSFILDRIKRKAMLMRGMPKYKGFACFEFTQNAGETVYVPHGWWHAVLNLTDTVAVTQNFCSPRNFDAVWLKTRTGRKRMAWKWLCALEKDHPELAARAQAMNAADNFVMKYDPVEVERRERAEREAKAEAKRRKNERKEAEQSQKKHRQHESSSSHNDYEDDNEEEEDDDRLNEDEYRQARLATEARHANGKPYHSRVSDDDDEKSQSDMLNDEDRHEMKGMRHDSPRSTVSQEI